MNKITLYQNVELTQTYGTCDVGATRDGFKPLTYLGAHYDTIDDVKYFSVWGFNGVRSYPQPEPTFVFVPQSGDALHRGTFYISSVIRFTYQYNPTIWNVFQIFSMEMLDRSGSWQVISNSEFLPSIRIDGANTVFEGVGFYYGQGLFTAGSTNNYKGYGYYLALRTRDTSVGTTDTSISMFFSENFLEAEDGKRTPTKNTRKGGGASGRIQVGAIPATPTADINSILMTYCQGNGYGLTYYKLLGNALSQITARMFPKFSIVQSLVAARREAFISVVAVPYNVPSVATSHNTVYLADATVTIDGAGNEARLASQLLIDVDLGTFTFTNQLQNDFTDIAYTEYTLYLPSYGTVSIAPSACAQGYVKVIATLDVRNGNVIYKVITWAMGDELPSLWGHYPANVAVKIPVSGVSPMGDALGLVTNLGKTAASAGAAGGEFYVGNVVGGVQGITEATSSFSRAIEETIPLPRISNSHILDANISGVCAAGMCMIITQNRILYEKGYTELLGRPSAGLSAVDAETEEEPSTLNLFAGFFTGKLVKVEGISGMTDVEIEELRTLLEEGVWLS